MTRQGEDGNNGPATQLIELIMSLRSHGIKDTRVLAAMERVPRALFVPQAWAGEAYADMALPIGCGQTISQPYVVAYMTELLELNERMKVLEVGTGSGYQAAILAHLARRVYTIERHGDLVAQAEERFRELGLSNITAITGDGSLGWPEQAPFDRIIVTAAAEETPQALLDQLKVGGRLIIPVGPVPDYQYIMRIDRTKEGYTQEKLLPVRFVPLVSGKPTPS